jgi:hypothetical protein
MEQEWDDIETMHSAGVTVPRKRASKPLICVIRRPGDRCWSSRTATTISLKERKTERSF